jgi:hypothetical protein
MKLIQMFFLACLGSAPFQAAWALCQEGKTFVCTVGACKGVSECIGGRWTGCQVEPSCSAPKQDVFTLSNALPNEEIGLLFDGRDTTGSFNDRRVLGTSNAQGAAAINAGANVGRAFGGTVTAFSRGRSPTTLGANWTAGADNLPVVLDAEVGFRVTFWILAPGFNIWRTLAARAVVDLNALYLRERTGLRITGVSFRDATANPAAVALLDAQGANQAQYVNQIGFTSGEMNMYVTNTVEGANNRAFTWDGTPLSTIAGNALVGSLIGHEFGHSFVLAHVGAPDFDGLNIMSPTVSPSPFFSEGQVFNMHRHPSSMVNALFAAHPGQPSVACPAAATPDCPATRRRLWPDGSLAANDQ